MAATTDWRWRKLIASNAGEGDVGLVGVEAVDGGGEGGASPAFGLLEGVVPGLLALETAQAMLRPRQNAGGVDDDLLLAE
jgi:hypothetical protein